jgi:hypothetical protein
MKTFSLLILAFSILAARADSTNASGPLTLSTNVSVGQQAATNAPTPAGSRSETLSTDLSKQLAPSTIIVLEPKPNELSLGRLKVSGIAIEAVKTGEPLKLINPFSPPTNSSPEDNVVRDPFNGKVNGLKVFAVHF